MSVENINQLMQRKSESDVRRYLSENGITLNSLRESSTLMEQIADVFGKKYAAEKDDHEVFVALSTALNLFPGSEIGFPIKTTFDPKKNTISSFEELHRWRAIDDPADFLIRQNDVVYSFQLKRYKGTPKTADLLTFLEKTINGYYGQLGDISLIVILQGGSNEAMEIDFDSIHKDLTRSRFIADTTVLICYNANGKHDVIQQVFPQMGRQVTNLLPFSEQIATAIKRERMK